MLVYNIKQEVLRIGKKKGSLVYYAAQQRHPKVTTKQVEERIAAKTALSRHEIRDILRSFSEAVCAEILAGNAVDLLGMGALKIVSIGKRQTSREDVSLATLKTARIQFLPKNELKAKAQEIRCRIEELELPA